jgi:enamine deaminase RidA (YjgF/YER057c/UK114 family)
VRRFEHTTTPTTPTAAEASSDDLSTQLNDLMDSFAEARELIKDAMESVGTTYFADDMEDAEQQAKDVLKRWADVQAFLEKSGETAELQKLRNMHDLKIKQMEAELETVRDAGCSG